MPSAAAGQIGDFSLADTVSWPEITTWTQSGGKYILFTRNNTRGWPCSLGNLGDAPAQALQGEDGRRSSDLPDFGGCFELKIGPCGQVHVVKNRLDSLPQVIQFRFSFSASTHANYGRKI